MSQFIVIIEHTHANKHLPAGLLYRHIRRVISSRSPTFNARSLKIRPGTYTREKPMVSDDEIDALIDRVKPELRIALRSILNGSAVHFFNIGSQPLANGERWDVDACVMSEPISRLVESVTGGVEKMGQSYAKLSGSAPGLTADPSRQH